MIEWTEGESQGCSPALHIAPISHLYTSTLTTQFWAFYPPSVRFPYQLLRRYGSAAVLSSLSKPYLGQEVAPDGLLVLLRDGVDGVNRSDKVFWLVDSYTVDMR